MGLPVSREHYEAEEYERFALRLKENLDVLENLLAVPGFGEHPPSLGAEMEVSIVDSEGFVLPLNRAVLAESLDDNLALELDRFNLEYNLTPVACEGEPFRAIEAEAEAALSSLNRICAKYEGRVAAIGILPTLRPSDLTRSAMTDLPRYRALSAGLRRLRRDPFRIEINGEDQLDLTSDDVTLEGATTSFQVHLRVRPGEFGAAYNAAQLSTPVVLALCANSPTLLGKRLWDETRVALFKQAVDSRVVTGDRWRPAARVSFGHGWVRDGAYELFAEAVALFPPLLPVLSEEDPVECVRSGGVPRLDELRLHHGTVWRWNRAVFDPQDGGHLRIELRSLPSGPTPLDMMAGAALHVGLTWGLRRRMAGILPGFPFEYAHWNFYRAAQAGLDAKLLWPATNAPSPVERPVRELALELLPVAAEGLSELGVDAREVERLLAVIRGRLEAGLSPARWQRSCVAHFETQTDRASALAQMLDLYLREAETGRPIHEWSEPA